MSTSLIAIGVLLAAIGAIGVYHAEAVATYGGWGGTLWLATSRNYEPSSWQVAIHRALMAALTLLGVAIALAGAFLLFGVR